MTVTLVDRPNMHLFWSAYDPLDLASESIDPLGFMAAYIALADRILPGFTTITTVPRYAGMLCHALRLARDRVGEGSSTALRRREMIASITAFERAWALACGLAEATGTGSATGGLRGVRAVHRWLALRGEKTNMSISYSLLSNQVRYGGLGAYSTFLESLHLADMTAMTLRPMGEELANAFPSPAAFGLIAFREEVRLPVGPLTEWGRNAHTGTLSSDEARCLRAGLHGGEEAEFDDRTRWAMLRLLRYCSGADLDESALLAACLEHLRDDRDSDASLTGEEGLRIRLALQLIEPYERLYQCALFLFDRIRAAASDGGHVVLETIANDAPVVAAFREMRSAATRLLNEIEAAADHISLRPASQALEHTGLLGFARMASSSNGPLSACQEVLRRHARVQEGKFDGSLPKGPWVRFTDESSATAHLTAQRFGLEPSAVAKTWRNIAKHPYRTFGAMRFVRLCRVN